MAKSGLLDKSALLAFTTFLAKGASFLAAALVARSLSPNDMGILDISLFVFMSLLPLGALNLATASTIFVSTAKEKEKLAFSLLVTLILVQGVFSFLALIFFPYILAYIGPEIGGSIALIILIGFLFVLHNFSLSLFQGLEKFKVYALLLALQPFIFLLIQLLSRVDSGLFLVFAADAPAVLRTYFLSYLLPSLIAVVLLFKANHTFETKPAFQVLKYAVKKLWWPIALGGIISFYIRSLVFINDPVNNAILRILDQYNQLLIIPVSAFILIIFPKLSQAASGQIDFKHVKVWMRKYIGIVLLGGFIVSFAGVILIPFIFGSKYVSAIQYVGFYGIFIILSLFSSIIGQLSLANPKWTYLWSNSAVIVILADLAIALWLQTLRVNEIIWLYLLNSIFVIVYFAFDTRKELGFDKMLLNQIIPIAICFMGLTLITLFTEFAIVIGFIIGLLLLFVMHYFKLLTLQELREIFITTAQAQFVRLKEMPKIIKQR